MRHGLPEDSATTFRGNLSDLIKNYRILRGAGKTLRVKFFDPSEFNTKASNIVYRWHVKRGDSVTQGQELADVNATLHRYTLDGALYEKEHYSFKLVCPRDGKIKNIADKPRGYSIEILWKTSV